jgi:Delta3-Delta2-enoyl-CoA isomerase
MILATNHGAVRELRLNRPPVNALNKELIVALRQAVEAAPQEGIRGFDSFGCARQVFLRSGCATLLGLDRAALAAL